MLQLSKYEQLICDNLNAVQKLDITSYGHVEYYLVTPSGAKINIQNLRFTLGRNDISVSIWLGIVVSMLITSYFEIYRDVNPELYSLWTKVIKDFTIKYFNEQEKDT